MNKTSFVVVVSGLHCSRRDLHCVCWAQEFLRMGLVAQQHVGSILTRSRTLILSVAIWILKHYTSRKFPLETSAYRLKQGTIF